MPAMWPNSSITFPFSGIASGFVVHPDHTIALYLDLSGVQRYIGFNPLNGFNSITERISGIESGYWNLSQEQVNSPLFLRNVGSVAVLSGQNGTAIQNGFITATDWTSFNSRVFRAGDTITGGLTVLDNLSGLKLFDSGIRPVGFIVNLGTVNSVIGSKSDNVYNIKGILAGSGIGITSTANDIIISSTGVAGTSFVANAPLILQGGFLSGKFATLGESGFLGAADWSTFNNKISSAANVGGGQGVYKGVSVTTLEFKSLIPGQSLNFGVTTNDITINVTGVLTGVSNYGNGSGLFTSLSGNNANFKSLIPGTNITFSVTPNDITVNASTITGTFGNFNYTYNETPGGLVNSSNNTFTLLNPPSPSNSLHFFKNGILLAQSSDYSLSSSTITTFTPPVSGSILLANYSYASPTGIGLYTVGVTTPSSTTLNSLATWGNTTGTILLTNTGIRTDGVSSLSFGGNLSGITSGIQNIGSSGIPFANIYSNQYSTSLLSGNPGGAATSYNINWNFGSSQMLNFNPGFSGNVSINLLNGIPGSSYTLQTIQNPSGTTNLAWQNNVKWQGGVSGTPTASGNAIDLFNFWYNGFNYMANNGYNYR